jgi:hypothetical protein
MGDGGTPVEIDESEELAEASEGSDPTEAASDVGLAGVCSCADDLLPI